MNQKLKEFLKDPVGNIPDRLISWVLFISMSCLIGMILGMVVCKILGK
jgi:hypothetical protein